MVGQRSPKPPVACSSRVSPVGSTAALRRCFFVLNKTVISRTQIAKTKWIGHLSAQNDSGKVEIVLKRNQPVKRDWLYSLFDGGNGEETGKHTLKKV